MLERLQSHTLDVQSALASMVADQGDTITRAAAMLVDALVQGKRIYCAGIGPSANNASTLVYKLIHHFEHERPALPALLLGDPHALESDTCTAEPLLRTFEALSQSGDVMVALCGSAPTAMAPLIRASGERSCPVIVLASQGTAGEATHLLHERDCLIALPDRRPALDHDLQLFVLHALCDLIDHALFGVHDA